MFPRNVPWLNWDEWSYVKDLIFGSPESAALSASCASDGLLSAFGVHAHHGVEIANMWRIRGRVPHSVESTVQLIEILLHDAGGSRDEMELRLQYSLAIIRAVNGLVDPSQQGVFADSIYSIAQTLGLPGWIVELRHDATHNQLPALPVLRSAAKQLALWFRENYWESQARFLELLTVSSSTVSSGDSEGAATVAIVQQDSLLSAVVTSSTVLSEIFIPLFLTSIMMQVHGVSTAATLRAQAAHTKNTVAAVQKLFNKQRGHWWKRISDVAKVYGDGGGVGDFMELLICRLFAYAVACCSAHGDRGSRSESSDLAMEKRVALCDLWIEALCKSKMSKKILQDGKGGGCWTALASLSEAKLSAAKGEGDGGVREVVAGAAAALASVHGRVAAFYSRSSTNQADNDSEEQEPRGAGEGGYVAIDGGACEEGDDGDSVVGASDVPEDESESADAIKITTNPSPSPSPAPATDDEDDLASFEKLAGLVPFVHATTNTDSSFSSKRQRREVRDAAAAAGGQELTRGGEWVKMGEMPQWPLGLLPGKTESFLFSLGVQQ